MQDNHVSAHHYNVKTFLVAFCIQMFFCLFSLVWPGHHKEVSKKLLFFLHTQMLIGAYALKYWI